MFRTKGVKRFLSILCTTILLVIILAGCGSTDEQVLGTSDQKDNGTVTETKTSEKENVAPEKASIMIPLYSAEAPPKDSPIYGMINEITKAELDIQFIPSDSYNEKINVAIASNELPDTFVITDFKGSTFVNAARSGMFWDMTDYLPHTQYLSKNYDEVTLYNASLDGRHYMLPRSRVLVRNSVNYRVDWLEKLGLEAPSTPDEIYEVAKAFAEQDPDENGIDDTIGFITGVSPSNSSIGGLSNIVVAYGGPFVWGEDDNGELKPNFFFPAYKDALEWYKKLYDEGLLNKDFAAVSGNRIYEIMNAEQAGLNIANCDELVNRFDPLLKLKAKDNPDIKLEDIFGFTAGPLSNNGGEIKLPAGRGFWGGFAFPKTTLETEDRMLEVLNIVDMFDSPEAKDLLRWGVEGIHYERVDGKAKQTDDIPLYTKEVDPFAQLLVTGRLTPNTPGILPFMSEKVEIYYADNAKHALSDLTGPLISDTAAQKGAQLEKIVNDASIKYIMGIIDLTEWEKSIEEWQKQGGDDIIREYNSQK
ncbi:extracellular solute-binding protein [Vallitalea okinawensis]|uniref:extracellular solute-binding protein n=1 Tax=Vallitalea okinawensis TaxID=2078660 RepID=UPI000CFBAFEC|nr:extracellular solute-binding protein [Vallitalea okinawensis]